MFLGIISLARVLTFCCLSLVLSPLRSLPLRRHRGGPRQAIPHRLWRQPGAERAPRVDVLHARVSEPRVLARVRPRRCDGGFLFLVSPTRMPLSAFSSFYDDLTA